MASRGRPRRRPQGVAHACPTASASTATATTSCDARRRGGRHPLRQRGRDHAALRGRLVRRRPSTQVRGQLRDRLPHLRRAGLGRRHRRRRSYEVAGPPGRPRWSTPPAPATSTPPGSSTATRRAAARRVRPPRLDRRLRGDRPHGRPPGHVASRQLLDARSDACSVTVGRPVRGRSTAVGRRARLGRARPASTATTSRSCSAPGGRRPPTARRDGRRACR